MIWRLYYADGSVFTNEDGTWAQAPDQGVQVLVFDEGYGWNFTHGIEEPYRLPGRKSVKHGSLTSDANYDRIFKRAYRDAGVKR